MSTHLHRAIGWGVPIEDFDLRLDLDPKSGSFYDDLEEALEPFDGLKYTGDDVVWRVINKGLIVPKGKNPSTLLRLVGNGDDIDHVLLFPTGEDAEKWHHFSTDIDWVFASTFDRHDTLQSIFDYLPFMPLSIFSDLRMNSRGEPVKKSFRLGPVLLPGIPDVMRFWLTHCGILDLAGIAKLRPMRAQWWG